MRGWKRYKYWILAAIALLAVLGLSTLPVGEILERLQNWLTALGPWGTPIFILVYVLITLVGFPGAFLIVVAGPLFGFLWGVLWVSLADTLGAIACYGLGRTVARKSIKEWLMRNPRFSGLDQAIARDGWKIVLLMRLSPIFPSSILNYGFSLTRVDFWHYCFFSWLGMIPVILLYVYLGAFGANLLTSGSSPGQVVMNALGLLATVGAACYTTRLAKSALTVSDEPEE